ncbi:MAG: 30S ribosomal protein S12 methylthiotransferase RimO [Tannerellaceae bacterium]|jgi:ribosomal protein S12 methylthiotransferase|nr:30S ribosomal protein S12 methylthiotransferase RimO [Tannerellaceae bacterium]
MKKGRVDIITLGCSKNLVDSELLMRQFAANGYQVNHDSNNINGEIVVVNTCGFINEAKEEAIQIILEMGEAKKRGRISQLFVMGCLSERFADELRKELPEVDRFYGKFNWKEMLADIGKSYQRELAGERTLATPAHYAYLKISEGCDRTCSYCSIPIMTGKHQSRTFEDIEQETKGLVRQGVKEFQIIAQDLTYYGLDIYRRAAIAELVERIADIEGVEWIRLHYAYPAGFPLELLSVIKNRPNVCNYLDIAFQHISENMLKMMRRNISRQETFDLLNRIREDVPGIHIRTTLIVGHPGETEDDFEELADFVKRMRFERLGAFAYSHEESTWAYRYYKDDVQPEIKQERLDKIMRLQENISAEIQAQKEGRIFKVIIDREEGDYYVGRTEYDSPEVDPEALITKDKQLMVGDFYNVKIYKSEAFDLYGKAMES